MSSCKRSIKKFFTWSCNKIVQTFHCFNYQASSSFYCRLIYELYTLRLNYNSSDSSYTPFSVNLPCNLRASQRTFSIKMSEMGQSRFQFPTVKKISMINGEDQSNNHDHHIYHIRFLSMYHDDGGIWIFWHKHFFPNRSSYCYFSSWLQVT